MAIENVVANARGRQRSVDFYAKFLDVEVVGDQPRARAVLDRRHMAPDNLQKAA